MKKIFKTAAAILMTAALAAGLAGCAGVTPESAAEFTNSLDEKAVEEAVDTVKEKVEEAAAEEVKTFKVGICNYVDDASLNQIVENIESQLETLGKENNVKFEIQISL